MTNLQVSEIYGPVLQGEGPDVGKPTIFLRLMACNLACVWCDTAYTWDASRFDLKKEGSQMTLGAVVKKVGDLLSIDASVTDYGNMRVDISGGEPMLQQAAIAELLEERFGEVASTYLLFDIETAGTIPLLELNPYLIARFNVSPKLEHSGNLLKDRYKPEVLKQLNRTTRAAFKFVCQQPSDLDEVAAIVSAVGIEPKNVWIMPEGVDPVTVMARHGVLEEAVLERRWQMSTRLQILAHGDQRGT